MYTRHKLERLIQQFESQTLPKSEWTHEAHLAVAIWYCHYFPEAEALKKVRTNIWNYNESVGTANTDSSGYHETLTRFWIWTAKKFIEEAPESTLIDWVNACIQSPQGQKSYPLKFYSQAHLFSVRARNGWVEPDILPLKGRYW